MEPKKISFGFMKTKKTVKPVEEEKKDFIDCVEEKSIKVIGGEEIKDIAPLVIPMKPNTLITAEKLKQIAEEVEKSIQEPEKEEPKIPEEDKPPENETLDQMALRELIQDAKKEKKIETAVLTVPIPALPVLEGQKESTLDDYEAVPIQDFGMAMLRGMGWTPGKEQSKYKQPELRPKGLGLGADKVVKENQKKNASTNNKEAELSIVKNAYVKITSGKYTGYYGKVVSLDEDNGRVVVDIPVKKETVSLSEFMMQPVTKTEFDKQSRIINADSYEEYKKNEGTASKKVKDDLPKSNSREASSSKRDQERQEERNKMNRDYADSRRNREKEHYENTTMNKEKDNERRDRSSSSSERDYRKSKLSKKRYSSNDSLSSLSDDDKKIKKERKKRSSSIDSSESERRYKKEKKKKNGHEKRDIDKKRKGKKKKKR